METQTEKLTYCLYVRKSTESEERQVMSIDSQIKEMMKISERDNLDIVSIKRRIINKASVADRIIHHAIVRVIEPFYEKRFIHRSYASRKSKGLHKGVKELRRMMLAVTRNDTRKAYYLKCDIKKFFDSVDHDILKDILQKNIRDQDILDLLVGIIDSFHTEDRKGLPLGNYTSQLFANMYMNELDQYIKRVLRIKHYIRYSDDFVILGSSKKELIGILEKIKVFLNEKLHLRLHKEKIFLNQLSKGIDFLGYVVFPHHMVLRTRTKKRMYRKFKKNPNAESLASYIGMTKHAYSNNIRRDLLKIYFEYKKK